MLSRGGAECEPVSFGRCTPTAPTIRGMGVEVRPFRLEDAAAHSAGEDELIVTWLTGVYADVEHTRAYFEDLLRRIDGGLPKRPFGIWLDDRLCGYIDYDPEVTDGLAPGRCEPLVLRASVGASPQRAS